MCGAQVAITISEHKVWRKLNLSGRREGCDNGDIVFNVERGPNCPSNPVSNIKYV